MLPKHLEARLEREKEADFSYIDPRWAGFASTSFTSAACSASRCGT
jgi:hypothetical protein